MKNIKNFFILIKLAFREFINDDCLKLSASLSYYTIFSLAPFLIIVISLAGIFFGQAAVEGKIFDEIHKLVGNDSATTIQNIVINIQHSNNTKIGAIIGAVILVIGASGIFTEIQSSINYIWSIRVKPSKGWLKFLTDRLLSFSLIAVLGFILLVSLVLSAMMDLLNEWLMRVLAKETIYIVYILNDAIIVCIITLFFMVIYKVLPDAKVYWKSSFAGSMLTSILFLIGKFAIGYYIGNSKIGLMYGTAASIIVLLTWVYYTSIILYFGAEFTKVYAVRHGKGIVPDKTAVFIIKKESKEIGSTFMEHDL